jgi:hypothetical protein
MSSLTPFPRAAQRPGVHDPGDAAVAATSATR